MKMAKRNPDREASDAVWAFKTKMAFQSCNDRELRIVIKTVREMLLLRQQERATKRAKAGA
jgi:hypothetical protein